MSTIAGELIRSVKIMVPHNESTKTFEYKIGFTQAITIHDSHHDSLEKAWLAICMAEALVKLAKEDIETTSPESQIKSDSERKVRVSLRVALEATRKLRMAVADI